MGGRPRRGWIQRGLTGGVLVLSAAAVTAYQALLPPVAWEVTGPAALPPIDVSTRAVWDARRPELLEAFQRDVYGRLPAPAPVAVETREPLPAGEMADVGALQQIRLRLGQDITAPRVHVLLAIPRGRGPFPLILGGSFCGNRAARPQLGTAVEVSPATPEMCSQPFREPLARAVFGRHANEPPWREILKRGYAYATFYPGDVVPDAPDAASRALARLQPDSDPPTRAGAIAAWAWTYLRVLDALDADPRLDPRRTAVWGHSRNGKAAILAAAADPRIEVVIAHQAGRGGSALSRSAAGESVAQLTSGYPHWFSRRYADYAGREAELPVDQHQLIALIAPRAVLLGHGRRDLWSDPHSSFRALQAASPAWRLHGVRGLEQKGLDRPDLTARVAAFMRPGRHGIHRRDWAYFLEFIDAQILQGEDRAPNLTRSESSPPDATTGASWSAQQTAGAFNPTR